MNKAGIAYRCICRSHIAAFIIVLLTILSFKTTESSSNIPALTDVETFSHLHHNDVDAKIYSCSSTANLHILVRSKAKVKVFFKKYFNRSLQVAPSYLAYKCAHYISVQIRSALRPAYYCFLFRYKPF